MIIMTKIINGHSFPKINLIFLTYIPTLFSYADNFVDFNATKILIQNVQVISTSYSKFYKIKFD